MSENPVRSASVEAAKEWLVSQQANKATVEMFSPYLTAIIERHLTPVVAAAEEAMKEKCAVVCDERAKSTFNRNTAIESQICATKIRAIPTGTALAEYVERATAELRAENKELADDYQSLGQERERELNSLKAQLAARESIFKWLLGEEGDFPMRTETFGAYWWRPALRQRIAALSAPAKEGE